MLREIAQSFKIACVYIGTVVGAGFASGQEMMQFFVAYGVQGMFGLILAGMLFGIMGTITLEIIARKRLNTTRDFFVLIFGARISRVFFIIVTIFMFVCFSAMLAGAGALFEQWYQLPYFFGVSLLSLLCTFVFLFRSKGIIFANSLLAPLLMAGFLMISFYLWQQGGVGTMDLNSIALETRSTHWLVSALMYVGYNFLSVSVVFSSMGNRITHGRVSAITGIITGVSLTLIGLLISALIFRYYGEVNSVEIPLLAVTRLCSKTTFVIFMVVFFASILSTAVGCGFGVLEVIYKEGNHSNRLWILSLILPACLVSGIGFSRIVKDIYPIFGALGLFEMVMCAGFMYQYHRLHRRNKR